jgi:hypothetical protein
MYNVQCTMYNVQHLLYVYKHDLNWFIVLHEVSITGLHSNEWKYTDHVTMVKVTVLHRRV